MRLKTIAILLICIIFTLSILDSPEYIHCIHLDLPGALALHAIVFNILKVDIVSKCYYVTENNFFSILENSLDNKEFFLLLNFISCHLLSVLIDCRNTDLENLSYTLTVFIENNTIATIPKLIGISIIRS